MNIRCASVLGVDDISRTVFPVNILRCVVVSLPSDCPNRADKSGPGEVLDLSQRALVVLLSIQIEREDTESFFSVYYIVQNCRRGPALVSPTSLMSPVPKSHLSSFSVAV